MGPCDQGMSFGTAAVILSSFQNEEKISDAVDTSN